MARSQEAIPYFEKAVRAAPNEVLAWNGLAFSKLRSQDLAGAADAFRTSLRLDPNQPPVAAALRQAESHTATRPAR
jgi:Flp pilus assembly protein TadD